MKSFAFTIAGILSGTLLLLLALFAGAEAPSASQPKVRSFEFTMISRIPALPEQAGKLRLWIPVPRSDRSQDVSVVNISAPVPFSRHREPEYGNEYVYLEVSAPRMAEPVEVVTRFCVTRRETRALLEPQVRTASVASLESPAVLQRFLAPDRLVPLNGIIAELSRQETAGLKSPLEKARAIYDYVTNTMRYDKSGQGWGRGDAVWACQSKRGNCTDFHSLFIGMMRAAGIPARFEIGFPLPPDKREGAIGGYHCWAQFYIPRMGWIPVDSSEAWKNPQARDYFFGALDEHRVLFTIGRDIMLDPPQQGGRLNYFVYPYAELGGKPLERLEQEFRFRERACGSPADGLGAESSDSAQTSHRK